MVHKCSFYCHENIHALRLLAKPGRTGKEILAVLDAEQHGYEIADIRHAHEADILRWREELIDAHMHDDNGLERAERCAEFVPLLTAPWIVLVRVAYNNEKDSV